MPTDLDVAIIGGGAAGYFAALRAAELAPKSRISIFESGRRVLEKVKISGGGRCNVTHSCFEPRNLIKNYPRGSKELLGAFHQFQPTDTIAWFNARNVALKTEDDGRMFPTTDSSQTILDCFERERLRNNIQLFTSAHVKSITPRSIGGFDLMFADGSVQTASSVVLATGSNRSGHEFAAKLGHTITNLAPSLFTFTVPDSDLVAISGISAQKVILTLKIDSKIICSTEGPLLVTHWGLSGPAVLRMSAWAARELHGVNYQADVSIDWTVGKNLEQTKEILLASKNEHSRKLVTNTPLFGLPSRLWEYLIKRILPDEVSFAWNQLSNAKLQNLAESMRAFSVPLRGKGQFKEEFVTCGGIKLSEVDFRTMQSKVCPGLFFAGEILDIDGITGGFNFQSAWTTGWIAGTNAAAPFALPSRPSR